MNCVKCIVCAFSKPIPIFVSRVDVSSGVDSFVVEAYYAEQCKE